jgi:hypothetical protein
MLDKIYPRKGLVYVALYFRNSKVAPDSYHWAILVESKPPSLLGGTPAIVQYHVKNTIQPGVSGQPWVLEQSALEDSSDALPPFDPRSSSASEILQTL